MKTSRNDPCPCGSGKKYKACCKPRDDARAQARKIIGAEEFDQAEATWLAAAREATEWAVDIAPAPGGVRGDPDAILSLAMVVAGEWVAHADVLRHRPAGADERARDMVAAVNAAERALGTLPQRLKVPDAELVEPVGRELSPRGITVVHGDSGELFDAMNATLAQMDPTPMQGRMTTALTWRETEASAEELAEFHQAAADFFAANPWVAEEPAYMLELPGGREWAASVMGALGQSRGLVLHSQPADLEKLFSSANPMQAILGSTGFSITVDFDRKKALTRAMQREVAAAGWPVAGPSAYPRLYGLFLPARRILPEDVRLMTLAMRAITSQVRGGDPLADTGVGVSPFDPGLDDEDDDSRIDWFHVPDRATPIRAEGPGAETEPRFPIWDSREEHQAAAREVEARVGRFAAWLEEQRVPAEERAVDVDNVEAWAWMLGHLGTSGAPTEFDLRLFLYDSYERKTDPTAEAVDALPRSMRRLFRWLEEREGVHYPFAPAMLDELDGIAERARAMGEPLRDTLRILAYDVYDYLDGRSMLASSDGWPDMMTIEVAQLRDELQRRWLWWYDELVRAGMTDYGELADELLRRQNVWETTPHPRVGGRTPRQVVEAQS